MCRVINLPGRIIFSFYFPVTERFQFIAMGINVSIRESLASPWCSLISVHAVLCPKQPPMQNIFVLFQFPSSLQDMDLWLSFSVYMDSSFPESKKAVLSTHILSACHMSWVPAALESSNCRKKLHFSDIRGILVRTIWWCLDELTAKIKTGGWSSSEMSPLANGLLFSGAFLLKLSVVDEYFLGQRAICLLALPCAPWHCHWSPAGIQWTTHWQIKN